MTLQIIDQETTLGQLPENAIFSWEPNPVWGLKYQVVGGKIWPIGHRQLHPDQEVRSGRVLNDIRDMTFEKTMVAVKVIDLPAAPLPYMPGALRSNDFSYFPI